jgi:alanine racemase
MRPARALIDLQALRHNYQLAREVTGAKALAVIKADAYGHGAVRVAQALEAWCIRCGNWMRSNRPR